MSSSRTSTLEEARPKKEGVYGPEDFYAGDLVWGKSGKNEPFWPAIIIDPMTQAPELVLRSCIPDAACVMFFGHSGTENERVMCILSSSSMIVINFNLCNRTMHGLEGA